MERLSIEQIINKINKQEVFHAISEDYSFTLKIEKYVHYVCGAVHNGNQFRKSLWDNCLHSAYERWFEEDPETKRMIQTHPIVIAGNDSRFEYDLNRPPEAAIYNDAWGKELWKQPLTAKEKQLSLSKHANFYKVVQTLISKLEEIHTNVIVYDIHSYNWKRWDREVPTFNIGAGNVNMDKYGSFVTNWQKTLSEIKIPYNIDATSKINDVFTGNGYFLKNIMTNFKNTLVLATEVKKIYCDELNQIIYPEVVDVIAKELVVRLKNHAILYSNSINS